MRLFLLYVSFLIFVGSHTKTILATVANEKGQGFLVSSSPNILVQRQH